MTYQSIKRATFLSRPNRFIAHCLVDGMETVCHVKNTGRCRELLLPGVTVYLEKSENGARKTAYDLVSVDKQGVLFNIDATAPNTVTGEWLAAGGLFSDLTLLRPETTFGSSRFDFYLEHGGKRAFIEVKGVTLEKDGVLLFPDAPTQRGTKHIAELCTAVRQGYEAYLMLVVQTEQADYFTPNEATDPAFARALREAAAAGVSILCYTCHTTPTSLEIAHPVPVKL